MTHMPTTTTITVRSEVTFNGHSARFPFASKYFIANPAFDPAAPRFIGQAVNPASVREIGGCSRSNILDLIRRKYRGQGTVTVVWDDGRKAQTVRTLA